MHKQKLRIRENFIGTIPRTHVNNKPQAQPSGHCIWWIIKIWINRTNKFYLNCFCLCDKKFKILNYNYNRINKKHDEFEILTWRTKLK